jgi:hypothetical protein
MEVEEGVPYTDTHVSLSEGPGFSRESLVVGSMGIMGPPGGIYEYSCIATNNNDNATTSISVTIHVPGYYCAYESNVNIVLVFFFLQLWKVQ